MRYLHLSLLSIITLILIGCSSGGHSTGPISDEYATIDAGFKLDRVASLAKTAAIDLKLYRLVLSSDKGDTIRDSSTISGNGVVQISEQYRVLSGRKWKLSVSSYDTKDSLIHSGSTGLVTVNRGDTLKLQLSLNSRFSMYRANFLSIPTFVSPSQHGNAQIPIVANRLVLKVGGKVRSDSSGSFQGSSVSLSFDYVPSGSQAVVLEVYGSAAGYTGILWSGSVAFDNSAGVDETKAVTLDWQGPIGLNGNQLVTLGRVGKNTIDASLAGAD